MAILKTDAFDIRSDADVVRVRQAVRAWSIELGFGLVEQTKLVTAASEIARNTYEYGGGGKAFFEAHQESSRKGLKLIFEDQGPGIKDIGQALTDGYTSGRGLGLGLGGARRLVNDFEIKSEPGKGTRVTLVRWR